MIKDQSLSLRPSLSFFALLFNPSLSRSLASSLPKPAAMSPPRIECLAPLD